MKNRTTKREGEKVWEETAYPLKNRTIYENLRGDEEAWEVQKNMDEHN